MLRLFVSAWLAGLTGVLAGAQTGRPNPFGGVAALSCRFSVESVGTWSDADAMGALKPNALSFQIKDVNTDEGSARFVDVADNVPIVARLARSSLNFIDVRPDGTFATLTVFERLGTERPFRSVYSRTRYYKYVGPGFTSVPEVEQFYGWCEPLQQNGQ